MNLDLLLIGAIILAAVLYLGHLGIKSLHSMQKKEPSACGKCGCSEKVS
jgi:hypothetical protein